MHCFRGGCLFFELRNNIIYNFSGICYQERMELFATAGCENKISQLVKFFIFAKIILYRYIIAETEGKIYNFTQKGAQKLRKASKHKKGEACGSAFYCIIL